MNSTQHLTEDQIDDLLIGDLAAEPAAHLAGCDPCQERVAAAQAPIASFKAISLAWSERRSATMPVKLPQMESSGWQRYATWAATATAVLVVALIVPMTRHESRPATVAPATMAAAASVSSQTTAAPVVAQPQSRTVAAVRSVTQAPTEEQIARDNQMLQAINIELDASVQSPADVFGVQSTGGRAVMHKRNSPVQNFD